MSIFGDRKFGFGLMRLPLMDSNDPGSLDLEKIKEMVDYFIAHGFTYFDTAWMYCAFKSESAVKEVLMKRYPREAFTLTTKLHGGFIKTLEDRDKIFNAQREKTGADFFDYYLLHDVGQGHYQIYTELDCFSWLIEKKNQGLVKHIGFSYHDGPELLDKVLTEHPEMEFVQLQLNYLDWDSAGVQSRKCYEVCEKHGKPVIVMEPVKGGTLAEVPDSVTELFKAHDASMSIPSWAIRFAASQPNVAMVLSGMGNMDMVRDNVSYMEDFKPLTDVEMGLCAKAAELINANITVPCTGCSYCTDGCPMSIAIPKYFSLYNADKQEIKSKKWTSQGEYYERLTAVFGKASDCVECGQCEGVCPQHLPIIQYLKDVAEYFEK